MLYSFRHRPVSLRYTTASVSSGRATSYYQHQCVIASLFVSGRLTSAMWLLASGQPVLGQSKPAPAVQPVPHYSQHRQEDDLHYAAANIGGRRISATLQPTSAASEQEPCYTFIGTHSTGSVKHTSYKLSAMCCLLLILVSVSCF